MKRTGILILSFLLILCTGSAVNAQCWRTDIIRYISSHEKSDGGYGWEDQPDSHLTPTYAVTGILHNLGMLPENRKPLAEFILTHHPQKGPNREAGPSGTEMRNLVYQQIQAILWLGGEVSSFNEDVKNWKSQAGMLANYESHNFAGLYQETMTPICNKLLGLTMKQGQEFIKYLESCRRGNGSFNNAPAPFGGDGNILNTYWSLYALEALGASGKMTNETITWLQSCQMKNGGFTHQPEPTIGTNDDVIYAWAGIKALKLMGAKPRNVRRAVKYLLSLRNADGGFGDRPGLHSTPVASFYAVDALKELDMLSALDRSKKPKAMPAEKPDFIGYKIFTVQFQAQGQGSPMEAVMLADSLNIDLWGVKYPVDGWVKEAQRIANEKMVPVTFFMSNEPHDNLVTVPGMGSFNHVLDYIAPANAGIVFAENATFEKLKSTTLKQLKEVNGGLLLQVSNNEPLARMLIDESINNDYGYLGLHTVHFGQNFMFWLPYLAEYRYRLPLVTLQDAHGTESWIWADELINHRNLFIAKNATYDEMVSSLRKNWIVGVRHDSVSGFRTRMLGGTSAARKFISDREKEWKWWDDNNNPDRPLAAITVVDSNDLFEAGKPDEFYNIRIRTRWNSIRQALRSPAVVLEELRVDGQVVETRLINVGRARPSDSYYLYHWTNPSKGTHTIVAMVRNLKDNEPAVYSTTYTVE